MFEATHLPVQSFFPSSLSVLKNKKKKGKNQSEKYTELSIYFLEGLDFRATIWLSAIP
jgi:hypothetical protein